MCKKSCFYPRLSYVSESKIKQQKVCDKKYDDDYHKWVPSKHDGGKPKQSLGDTPTKPGSLQKRTPVDRDNSLDVTKKGKLTKQATKSLKNKIKARND